MKKGFFDLSLLVNPYFWILVIISVAGIWAINEYRSSIPFVSGLEIVGSNQWVETPFSCETKQDCLDLAKSYDVEVPNPDWVKCKSSVCFAFNGDETSVNPEGSQIKTISEMELAEGGVL